MLTSILSFLKFFRVIRISSSPNEVVTPTRLTRIDKRKNTDIREKLKVKNTVEEIQDYQEGHSDRGRSKELQSKQERLEM